eukprot:TRINITY_DN98149_c0_g1_i1.p1 TRINITY_DN98149_c0_g1~~TRINITY_DN98149_c0_g1_i1.p1  ORF type:complete len:499 (+),score=84.60 TRINITY_DN98149_c0_g1_i1:132-1499(+)
MVSDSRGFHHHVHHSPSHQLRELDLPYHGISPLETISSMGAASSTASLLEYPGQDPTISEWACALMCASRGEAGCCAFKKSITRDGNVHQLVEDAGCEWVSGAVMKDESANESWKSSYCVPGFGTSKCAEWTSGRCSGKVSPGSLGLPVWEMKFEDHFDHTTCVTDDDGIDRPSPDFWTLETGYKRGKERQWYSPKNARCQDGKLIITAKREQVPPGEVSCTVRPEDTAAYDMPIDNATCAQCAPPTLNYSAPCNYLRRDDSGTPVCDCSATAEFTSASMLSRSKVNFSFGILEMRAKIDTRPGVMSSFWAVGDFHVPWPKNGEIDIMDGFQRMLKVGAIHSDPTALPENAVMHAVARSVDLDWEKDFHVWELEWDEKFIVIRVDSEEFFKLDVAVADPVRTTWPNPFIHRLPFFMVLSLAVGGHSGGNPAMLDADVNLEVDYIRHYEKKSKTFR